MEKCSMCEAPGTKNNPINNHHYRGRKNYPKDVMRVHSFTCHLFAQWLTNLYISYGREVEVSPEFIIQAYRRTIAQREDVRWLIPLYK